MDSDISSLSEESSPTQTPSPIDQKDVDKFFNDRQSSSSDDKMATGMSVDEIAKVAEALKALNTPAVNVSAVSVKAPKFLENLPVEWFVILEASFQKSGVKDSSTKFFHAVGFLNEDQVKNISDIVKDEDYDALKKRLLAVYGMSDEERMEKYWKDEDLGDRNPSQMFLDMCTLVEPIALKMTITRKEILMRWNSRLPPDVKKGMASLDDDATEEKQLKVADKCYRVCREQNLLQVSALEKQQFDKQADKRGKRNKPKKTFQGNNSDDVCWYHFTFGSKATKCREGCRLQSSMENKGNGSQ